jgi:hypothetical protein
LVAKHTVLCEQLREKRKGSADGTMVELDERISMKVSTIAALNRTIEATEWLINLEERSDGYGTGGRIG